MSNVLAKCTNIAIVHLYSPDDCSYLAEPFDGMADDGIIIHVQSIAVNPRQIRETTDQRGLVC